MAKTLNIAHRGFSGMYPENTKIAFEKAVEAGCDGFETDVHLSKDNLPVVIHDARLERTSDGTGFVNNYTFKELQQFNVAHNFAEKGIRPQKIMLLDELLTYTAQHAMFINIELKNYEVFYEGLEKIVLDKLIEFKLIESSIISSFNHISIEKCKSINKNIKTGYLYSKPLLHMDEYLRRNGGNALHPNFKLLYIEPDLVSKTHTGGGEVNTWTVNETADMQKLLALKVDSIITNLPDVLHTVQNEACAH